MKINNNETVVKTEGDVFEFSKTTKINEKKLNKLFHLLSNIYRNVEGSIIREYASNCWDANKKAGNEDKPIIVRFKKEGINNVLEFEDFGTGITPENIENVFINYLESDKEFDNESIGGFGIGAKSFFAYTTSFFISSLIRNECKIKYLAFGRELNSHIRKDFTIKLPILKIGNDVVIDKKKVYSEYGLIPDWKLMEDIIKSLPYGDRIQ